MCSWAPCWRHSSHSPRLPLSSQVRLLPDTRLRPWTLASLGFPSVFVCPLSGSVPGTQWVLHMCWINQLMNKRSSLLISKVSFFFYNLHNIKLQRKCWESFLVTTGLFEANEWPPAKSNTHLFRALLGREYLPLRPAVSRSSWAHKPGGWYTVCRVSTSLQLLTADKLFSTVRWQKIS